MSKIITEQDVTNHCKNSGATEFMCKNCGAIHNSLAVLRQYCAGCNCWLCYVCGGSLCRECKGEEIEPITVKTSKMETRKSTYDCGKQLMAEVLKIDKIVLAAFDRIAVKAKITRPCDVCGTRFVGTLHKVMDENHKVQRGLIQCGICYGKSLNL